MASSTLPASAPVTTADAARVVESSFTDAFEASVAATVFGLFLLHFGGAIPRLPSAHRAGAVRAIEQILFPGNPRARARLSLLLCIDAVVAERSAGTGLEDLFRRHFPDFGSDRDLQVLGDRDRTAYKDFAQDWLRWLFAGPFVDVGPHQSMPFMSAMGELMYAGEALTPATKPRTVHPAWRPEPAQAAFVVAATLHVTKPQYGAAALSSLDLIERAIGLWQPGRKGRWPAAAALADAIGLGVASESLRGQWDDHEARRERGVNIVSVPLDPLP